MSGQPETGSNPFVTFDVASLAVAEPSGTLPPATVVPVGGSFDIIIGFDGAGIIWDSLEMLGLIGYEVHYFAEGMGTGAMDADLGLVTGNLTAGGGPYTATLTTSLASIGVYLLSAYVIFPAFPAVAGFVGNVLIQVR
jgi:hypothetical protein